MDQWLTWIAVLLTVVALALILKPEYATYAKTRFQQAGTALFKFAGSLLSAISAIWNRSDFKEYLQAKRADIVDMIAGNIYDEKVAREEQRVQQVLQQQQRQQQRLQQQPWQVHPQPQQPQPAGPQLAQEQPVPSVDYERIAAESNEAAEQTVRELETNNPSAATIFNAWARRFLYWVMLIVMFATDIGIAAFRFEALGYFTIPPELRPLVDHVFFLTPFVFVCSILIAKQALEETGDTLPPYVKLVPFERNKKLSFKKALPGIVFGLGLLNSLLLVYAAASLGPGQTAVVGSYEFFLFIGLLLLTISTGILAGVAFWQTFVLLVGVPALLIVAASAGLLGLCAKLLSCPFILLEAIGYGLARMFGRRKRDDLQLDPMERRGSGAGTILLGLGSGGAEVAAQVGGVVKQLNAPSKDFPLLYADAYPPNGPIAAQTRLRGLAKFEPQISGLQDSWMAELPDALASAHSLLADEAATIICVSRDKEMGLTLRALKQYEANMKASQGLQQTDIQNPIRILLIWMLSRHDTGAANGIQSELSREVRDLDAWAKDPNSILAGTILISDESSLMTQAPQNDLLVARAIASFIMSSRYRNDLSLDKLAQQMKSSQRPFAALATGTIGVGGLILDFDGTKHGVLDDALLSLRLNTLMGKYFHNELTSYPDAPASTSAGKFATVMSPPCDGLLAKLKWMAGQPYNIVPTNVGLIAAELAPQIAFAAAGTFPDHGGYANPQLSLIYPIDRGVTAP